MLLFGKYANKNINRRARKSTYSDLPGNFIDFCKNFILVCLFDKVMIPWSTKVFSAHENNNVKNVYPTRQQLPRGSNRKPARARVLTSKNRSQKCAHFYKPLVAWDCKILIKVQVGQKMFVKSLTQRSWQRVILLNALMLAFRLSEVVRRCMARAGTWSIVRLPISARKFSKQSTMTNNGRSRAVEILQPDWWI